MFLSEDALHLLGNALDALAGLIEVVVFIIRHGHDEGLHGGGVLQVMKSKRTKSEATAAKRMLELLRAGKDVRGRKVRKIRAAIKVKRYENAMKLGVAIEKLPLR